MTHLFASLAPDVYPTVQHQAQAINEPDSDAEFDFGLATILDGVGARLAGTRPRAPKRGRGTS